MRRELPDQLKEFRLASLDEAQKEEIQSPQISVKPISYRSMFVIAGLSCLVSVAMTLAYSARYNTGYKAGVNYGERRVRHDFHCKTLAEERQRKNTADIIGLSEAEISDKFEKANADAKHYWQTCIDDFE